MKRQDNSRATLHAQALILAVVSMLLTSGCGPGFESMTAASCVAGEAACGKTGGLGAPPDGSDSPAWDNIKIDGSINGGRFDRTKVVEIDKSTKTLVIRLPFIAGIQVGVEAPLPIEEIPGATIGIELATDGSSALVLRLPLEKVLRGVDFLPPSRLPNGDPLPAIPGGELPSVGIKFRDSPDLAGAIYLSPTVVGLFVNTKFDPFLKLTLPIRDQARTKTYGYFTSVPAKPGFDGGFFLSIALPDELARAIDDLL